MKIELIKPWGLSPSGTILHNINKPIADLLIERKIARPIKKKRAKKNGK